MQWSAICLMMVLLAGPAHAQSVVQVDGLPPVPEYCIYTSPPGIEEKGSDGSCTAGDPAKLVFRELNDAYCKFIGPCPGGGPFQYHLPRPPYILP